VKVGDLIVEIQFPDDPPGLIIKIKDRRIRFPYLVLCANGKIEAFRKAYVENCCEVISESW
jgi:hypothetical protein